jgi:alpha-L-fucosidase
MITRRDLLIGSAVFRAAGAAAAPAPFGAIPSPRQLRWHEMEVYAFLHFTINTFTDKEWGYGDEDPALFEPSAFDADAIVKALASGGMTGVILTCKHHDGFCLWPTATTEHSVRKSPWRGGKGDVVRDLSEAAQRHGLTFGVYVSPWDRNHAQYGRPEYVKVYREQLRELLTGYGAIFEVWHDGANGGDGFYGGAREKRTIDKRTYYDWPRTWELVRRLQPDAVIFSDVGPDIRWVGNEKGYANDTCWATYDPAGPDGGPPAPGHTRDREGMTGHRRGSKWMPPECDVSIRPGWFWHESQNSRVRSSRDLMDLYLRSVGRGGSFLLNVPPDRRGLLHENDIASLAGFGDSLRATFRRNLAEDARRSASSTRPGSRVQNLVNGKRDTFWASDDTVREAEVILDFRQPVAFDLVRVREFIPLGQRVEGVAVDAWSAGAWKTVAEATSIGNCRLMATSGPIATARVRLRVTKSAACPVLSEFGLFRTA